MIGPGAPPPLATLKAAVRRSVPDTVPVTIIEDSGRTDSL